MMTDGFVFKKEIEEVILHATVVDDQNRLITALSRDNFKVYEDGKLQEVTSFRQERVPVALGILIDNSGSMLPKRAKVNHAALQLVDASQQEDRVFVVNFGEDAFLDQDYTQDVGKLRGSSSARRNARQYCPLRCAHRRRRSPASNFADAKEILLARDRWARQRQPGNVPAGSPQAAINERTGPLHHRTRSERGARTMVSGISPHSLRANWRHGIFSLQSR